jgi:hypothetical protein
MGSKTLNARLVVFNPTCAAKTTGYTLSWPLGTVILDHLDIVIPAGHKGLTGLAIMYGDVAIIPYNYPTSLVVGDDEKVPVDVDFEVGNPLTVLMGNNDIYPHTWYLRAYVSDIGVAVPDGTTTLLLPLNEDGSS